MPEPCPRCGARADLGCAHQPPEGPPPLPIREAKKKRKASVSGGGRYKIVGPRDGQGRNFHRRRRDDA